MEIEPQRAQLSAALIAEHDQIELDHVLEQAHFDMAAKLKAFDVMFETRFKAFEARILGLLERRRTAGSEK